METFNLICKHLRRVGKLTYGHANLKLILLELGKPHRPMQDPDNMSGNMSEV